MLRNNKYNKYDLYIVILLVSLAFGIVGGALQVVRLLAILFVPILLKHVVVCRRCFLGYVSCCGFVILYGMFSLLWSPDRAKGLEELVYYVVHFLLFFEILTFSLYAKFPIRSIALGWTFAVMITLTVALWEITTDNHLPMSVQESGQLMNTGQETIQRQFASVTFGNYNAYVTFLCFSLPFVLYRIGSSQRMNLQKISSIVTLLLSSVVILFNASRGGLLCLIIMFSVYLFTLPKNRYSFLMCLFIILLFGGVFCFLGDRMLVAIAVKSADGGLFEDSSRIHLWGIALKTLADTIGLGTGLGGLQLWMARFAGGGINIPHNMFLEVFVQFGVFIGIVFATFIIRIFFKIRSIGNINTKRVLYMALLSLPIVSIINSSYLLSPFVYMYFASIVVFVTHERFGFDN